MTRARPASVLLVLAAVAVAACADRVVTRVLHRSGCLVCHQPLSSDGAPEGIEDAHPWFPLTCTDCHGGNAHVCDGRLDTSGDEPRCDGEWVYDQTLAHPSPGDSPAYVRDLFPAELDAVDPAWLRFVNPGDLRVVSATCGRCHTAEAAAVRRSAHAHAAHDAPGEPVHGVRSLSQRGRSGRACQRGPARPHPRLRDQPLHLPRLRSGRGAVRPDHGWTRLPARRGDRPGRRAARPRGAR